MENVFLFKKNTHQRSGQKLFRNVAKPMIFFINVFEKIFDEAEIAHVTKIRWC